MKVQYLNKKRIVTYTTLLALAASLTSCKGNNTLGTPTQSPTIITDTSNNENEQLPQETTTTDYSNAIKGSELTITYDQNELEDNIDTMTYEKVTLNHDTIAYSGTGATIEGSKITITKAGTYYFTGTLSDGQLIVDTPDEKLVHIILDNVDITSKTSSPIYVKQCSKKTIITLAANSTNHITDTENYVFPDDTTDEPSAAIFSKDDLVINGSGTLVVTGNYKDGITSKDDLRIINGTITVNAVDDGIVGKDQLVIKDGTLQINSGDDGLKSSNDTDDKKGYVLIERGTITITSGDDGIHADSSLTILNGTIKISTSYEGLESSTITIDNGSISIVSSDDGINAASKNDNSSFGGRFTQTQTSSAAQSILTINGGTIVVDANGDGLDSNGSIVMTGGTVYVNGPANSGNGALDYDSTFDISGGTLVAAGSTGMAQTTSSTSTQCSIFISYSSNQAAETSVSLKDTYGNELFSYSPIKQYQSIVISTPSLKKNETYQLYSNNTKLCDITTSTSVTCVSDTGSPVTIKNDMGGGGPMGGGKGQRPNAMDGETSDTLAPPNGEHPSSDTPPNEPPTDKK